MATYTSIPLATNDYPTGCVDGWRDQAHPSFVPVVDTGEPLVDITIAAPEIVSMPAYQTPRGTHQLVRVSVAAMLTKAQALLPSELQLVLLDGWRSIDLQRELYHQEYAKQLAGRGVTAATLSAEEAALIAHETQKYVSLPSTSLDIPSPHNTGGAVDVAVAQAGKLLDLGTVHDDMSECSALTYCETNPSLGAVARDNRRMLYAVMTSVGFEPYADEWWHFNYGNQMAQVTCYYRTHRKAPAIYGAVQPKASEHC